MVGLRVGMLVCRSAGWWQMQLSTARRLWEDVGYYRCIRIKRVEFFVRSRGLFVLWSFSRYVARDKEIKKEAGNHHQRSLSIILQR